MERARVLDYNLQTQLKPYMENFKPRPSIYIPEFIAANQAERADNVLTGSKQEMMTKIREDIREFKKSSGVDKVIVLWTANTERFSEVIPGLNDTAENLISSIRNNESEVSPSTLFAVASILEGVSTRSFRKEWSTSSSKKSHSNLTHLLMSKSVLKLSNTLHNDKIKHSLYFPRKFHASVKNVWNKMVTNFSRSCWQVSFINGSPQNTFVPGCLELAEKKCVFVGGDDFKSGQTKLKSVLVDFLVSAGIKPRSIVSYNHLGNNDGKNLSAPQTFRSKEVRKCNAFSAFALGRKLNICCRAASMSLCTKWLKLGI